MQRDPFRKKPGKRLRIVLATDLGPTALNATRSNDAPPSAPRPYHTEGQRRRYRRDLLILWSAEKLGLSQRYLAEVFDLPRSRIATIIQSLKEKHCG